MDFFNSDQFIFIYTLSLTIKIVSRCFTGPNPPNKQQRQEKNFPQVGPDSYGQLGKEGGGGEEHRGEKRHNAQILYKYFNYTEESRGQQVGAQ